MLPSAPQLSPARAPSPSSPPEAHQSQLPPSPRPHPHPCPRPRPAPVRRQCAPLPNSPWLTLIGACTFDLQHGPRPYALWPPPTTHGLSATAVAAAAGLAFPESVTFQPPETDSTHLFTVQVQHVPPPSVQLLRRRTEAAKQLQALSNAAGTASAHAESASSRARGSRPGTGASAGAAEFTARPWGWAGPGWGESDTEGDTETETEADDGESEMDDGDEDDDEYDEQEHDHSGQIAIPTPISAPSPRLRPRSRPSPSLSTGLAGAGSGPSSPIEAPLTVAAARSRAGSITARPSLPSQLKPQQSQQSQSTPASRPRVAAAPTAAKSKGASSRSKGWDSAPSPSSLWAASVALPREEADSFRPSVATDCVESPEAKTPAPSEGDSASSCVPPEGSLPDVLSLLTPSSPSPSSPSSPAAPPRSRGSSVLWGYSRFTRARDPSNPRAFLQQAVFILSPLPLHALWLTMVSDVASSLWGLAPRPGAVPPPSPLPSPLHVSPPEGPTGAGACTVCWHPREMGLLGAADSHGAGERRGGRRDIRRAMKQAPAQARAQARRGSLRRGYVPAHPVSLLASAWATTLLRWPSPCPPFAAAAAAVGAGAGAGPQAAMDEEDAAEVLGVLRGLVRDSHCTSVALPPPSPGGSSTDPVQGLAQFISSVRAALLCAAAASSSGVKGPLEGVEWLPELLARAPRSALDGAGQRVQALRHSQKRSEYDEDAGDVGRVLSLLFPRLHSLPESRLPSALRNTPPSLATTYPSAALPLLARAASVTSVPFHSPMSPASALGPRLLPLAPTLWAAVLAGAPILVAGPTPSAVSRAVVAVAGLVAPLGGAGGGLCPLADAHTNSTATRVLGGVIPLLTVTHPLLPLLAPALAPATAAAAAAATTASAGRDSKGAWDGESSTALRLAPQPLIVGTADPYILRRLGGAAVVISLGGAAISAPNTRTSLSPSTSDALTVSAAVDSALWSCSLPPSLRALPPQSLGAIAAALPALAAFPRSLPLPTVNHTSPVPGPRTGPLAAAAAGGCRVQQLLAVPPRPAAAPAAAASSPPGSVPVPPVSPRTPLPSRAGTHRPVFLLQDQATPSAFAEEGRTGVPAPACLFSGGSGVGAGAGAGMVRASKSSLEGHHGDDQEGENSQDDDETDEAVDLAQFAAASAAAAAVATGSGKSISSPLLTSGGGPAPFPAHKLRQTKELDEVIVGAGSHVVRLLPVPSPLVSPQPSSSSVGGPQSPSKGKGKGKGKGEGDGFLPSGGLAGPGFVIVSRCGEGSTLAAAAAKAAAAVAKASGDHAPSNAAADPAWAPWLASLAACGDIPPVAVHSDVLASLLAPLTLSRPPAPPTSTPTGTPVGKGSASIVVGQAPWVPLLGVESPFYDRDAAAAASDTLRAYLVRLTRALLSPLRPFLCPPPSFAHLITHPACNPYAHVPALPLFAPAAFAAAAALGADPYSAQVNSSSSSRRDEEASTPAAGAAVSRPSEEAKRELWAPLAAVVAVPGSTRSKRRASLAHLYRLLFASPHFTSWFAHERALASSALTVSRARGAIALALRARQRPRPQSPPDDHAQAQAQAQEGPGQGEKSNAYLGDHGRARLRRALEGLPTAEVVVMLATAAELTGLLDGMRKQMRARARARAQAQALKTQAQAQSLPRAIGLPPGAALALDGLSFVPAPPPLHYGELLFACDAAREQAKAIEEALEEFLRGRSNSNPAVPAQAAGTRVGVRKKLLRLFFRSSAEADTTGPVATTPDPSPALSPAPAPADAPTPIPGGDDDTRVPPLSTAPTFAAFEAEQRAAAGTAGLALLLQPAAPFSTGPSIATAAMEGLPDVFSIGSNIELDIRDDHF